VSSIDGLLVTNTSSQKKSPRWLLFRWSSAGIRAKILVPLIVLMSLSLVGSTIGFIMSTNTTRNRLLDGMLNDEASRVVPALAQSELDVGNGARGLSRDPQLAEAMKRVETGDESAQFEEALLRMDARAISVRNRFRLDQVLIVNNNEQARVNVASYSELSQLSYYKQDVFANCRNIEETHQTHLITIEQTSLLVSCAPITVQHRDNKRTIIGMVYTVQDIEKTLDRIQREQGITANIALASDRTVASMGFVSSRNQPAPQMRSIDGERVRPLQVELGGVPLHILLLRSEEEINAIVGSGFQVMLISSAITLMLLLALGYHLAQGFTRPIVKLAHVAQEVAEGNLSVRAQFTHEDEIGKLGRAFDQATITIAELLDQRARKAGELHAILQSMANGVLAVDTDECIVMVNPVAADLLGQEQSALIGKPLSSLLHVDDPVLVNGLELVVEHVRRKLFDPDHTFTENRFSLGDCVVMLHGAPTLGSAGVLTGAVIVIQDITQAVEADRAKSTFIATASHEMRTPLAAMKGFVDIFLMGGTDNLNDNQRMFLDTIKRQTDNMVQMVNDLLEMARLEQGSLRAEQRWVALPNALKEVRDSLQPIIEKRQLDFSLDIAPDLPHIWIDALHLRRILTNLMSNAAKYAYEGGNVWVRAYQLDDPAALPSPPGDQPWKLKEQRSVVIEVEDTGVGIRDADQAKIFTRFFRSENPLTVEAGGSGLGLAITRSLTHLHNGQIGFRSVETQGSCFWVRLPAPTTEALHDGHESADHRQTTVELPDQVG
jgi:PAS domain S-box-containing protein